MKTRRELLALAGQAAMAGALAPRQMFAAEEKSSQSFGAVVGDPIAARIGETVLRDGGNAIDAAIAAAFAAGICAARNSGIGGYGGHAMIALAGGKKSPPSISIPRHRRRHAQTCFRSTPKAGLLAT